MVIATARQFDEMDDDALALALKCVSWTPRDVQHFLHSHRAR